MDGILPYEEIISLDNLFDAWVEFIRDKRQKQDVQEFNLYLLENIYALHTDLANFRYKHSGYFSFNISDPKPRIIHKAAVRDRLLHHAIHRKLYPFFDRTFIFDSYSCRIDKGTHKALDRFSQCARQVSKDNKRTCWVLKCDVKKFFANIDHGILLEILGMYISDKNILWLLRTVVDSFETRPAVGLPLGNLTSQLFVNVYMNEFDQFVKYKLKAKRYIRYADDFVIFSEDKKWLEMVLRRINEVLSTKFKLELHPDKVFIKTLASGVDFLGWVHFGTHRVLRTSTKRRMIKNVAERPVKETVNSYLGLLKHGDTYFWQQYIREQCVET